MQVFKKILLLVVLVLACKKPTLEEFHRELCYAKMDDDFIKKYENLPNDIEPKYGYFLYDAGPYRVSKADAKRVHLLKEGDIIFRIDDCAISNLVMFQPFEYHGKFHEKGYFEKLELLFNLPDVLYSTINLENKIWIFRNNKTALISVKKEGNTIKDPCDETCYEH